MLISSRYLVNTLNCQINLDISTSVFLIINHITYILIISLFISLFGLLFFIFKTDYKRYICQSIVATIAIIILCIDTEAYIRNHVHIDFTRIAQGIMKILFYTSFKLWIIFSVLSIPILFYCELYIIRWLEKKSWAINNKVLTNIVSIGFISFIACNITYFVVFSDKKQQTICNSANYLPTFYSFNKPSINTNKISFLQSAKNAIHRVYTLAKILKLSTAEERFNKIYETHFWKSDGVHRSGSGVALKNNVNLRNKLIEIVKEYNIKSILDGACGDFYWMNLVLSKLNLDKYIGGDIASYIIKQNKQNYNYNNVEFVHMDITKDKLPNADLMIVRDALSALSYADIKLFLTNFYTSNIKYLLVSTHNKEKSYFKNIDTISGDWRATCLFDMPFNFDKSKVKLTVIDSQGNGREMILLSKEDVPKTF
jgi:hypothetical protein